MLSSEQINTMMTATEKQVKTFSFVGVKTLCKVSHVHDADTCRVIFYFNGELIRVTVRLSEIDAPEIKPTIKQTEEEEMQEIVAGNTAKNRLKELVENKMIYIEFGKNDKYKRPLCDLFICNNSYSPCDKVQDILLKEKLVIEYTGGKKIPYKDW